MTGEVTKACDYNSNVPPNWAVENNNKNDASSLLETKKLEVLLNKVHCFSSDLESLHRIGNYDPEAHESYERRTDVRHEADFKLRPGT